MTQNTPVAAGAEGSKAGQGGAVSAIVIHETELGSDRLIRTVRIPVRIFSIAMKLVPRVIREAMAKEGFDLDAILEGAREIPAPATLAEVEDHEKHHRIVIALE